MKSQSEEAESRSWKWEVKVESKSWKCSVGDSGILTGTLDPTRDAGGKSENTMKRLPYKNLSGFNGF